MKKILIFYSKTGGGHLRAAEAIADEFKRNSHIDVLLYDALAITNSKKTSQPDKVFFFFSTKLVYIFNLVYQLTNNSTGTKFARYMAKNIWGKAMKKVIDEYQPDIIVSTHAAVSPDTISGKIAIPFATVCTDLGEPHHLWYDPKVDLCFVATKDIKEHFLTNKIAPKDNIIVSGYPLKKLFLAAEPEQVRTNAILLLGGGSGTGRLEEQVMLLQKALPHITFIVVCGINQKLREKLTQKNYPNVQVFGFVDNLASLITQSDMVLTKAGPGTIVEAAALKKPLIITSWVVAQEKDNIAFVEKNKLGIYCPRLEDLSQKISDVYKNYSNYISELQIENGTKKIVQSISQQFLS